jgi:hypothetical protein
MAERPVALSIQEEKRGVRLAEIDDFIPSEKSFDPDALRVMGEAYDMALAELHDQGQPAIVRKIIAERIILLAADGERDPARLSQTALTGLGVPR